MQSAKVRFSRAGDAFHYRWAARRCLQLIDPTSQIQRITVEASKEPDAPGEYVIDLAEYFGSKHDSKRVYYQLKHSTVRIDQNFGVSELGDTITGFAARFKDLCPKGAHRPSCPVEFRIVTNRPVGPQLKKAVDEIARGVSSDLSEHAPFRKAAKLRGKKLTQFCATLKFDDRESDYIAQKDKLRNEISEVIAGFCEEGEVCELIDMVAERALPDQPEGEILREHVLKAFKIDSIDRLRPCEPQFEPISHQFKRDQHDEILGHVLCDQAPAIIHAEGGVGKTMVARQLVSSLPPNCLGILYDCFGAGSYLSPAKPRHKPSDALVQMANEMATRGVCRPLIPITNRPDDSYYRSFKDRIEQTIASLRQIDPNALLVILVDAADNAEDAATFRQDDCFASALLQESMPEGCRLAMFCRTERIDRLRPPARVRQLSLESFSLSETQRHLLNQFPNATADDVKEFHRLSGGNPRVQANALQAYHGEIRGLLEHLGPNPTSVNEQISQQLEAAIVRTKDHYSPNFGAQVDAICRGLASLPPLIPIEVLARASGCEVAEVRSFIADLGRPLWLTDNSVQFRDEPTETWFRGRFAASNEDYSRLTELLGPLAGEFAYVARTLPELLLKAGKYEDLIHLAMSDELLPTNSVDEQDVRYFRLQFAFRAALRAQRFSDSAKLAFRAGEEVAGNGRRNKILASNLDIVGIYYELHRIQEFAYRRTFSGGWSGSENVYSAALLSSVPECQGDARGYLRSSQRWLKIYFEQRNRSVGSDEEWHETLRDEDIHEMCWTHLRLFGPEAAANWISSWTPDMLHFTTARSLVRCLIDSAEFDLVTQFLAASKGNTYLQIATVEQLMEVGRLPDPNSVEEVLKILSDSRKRPKRISRDTYQDSFTPAVIAYLEACGALGMSQDRIVSALNYYVGTRADSQILDHRIKVFIRGWCLRYSIQQKREPKALELLPRKGSKADRAFFPELKKRVLQNLETLTPWYYARCKLLLNSTSFDSTDYQDLRKRAGNTTISPYKEPRMLPYDLSEAEFSLLIWYDEVSHEVLQQFVTRSLEGEEVSYRLTDQLSALRAACRIPHLRVLEAALERSCNRLANLHEEETGPEERAADYVSLSRAVLARSRRDGAVYFSRAIETVSRFGDEMLERWDAVVRVAIRAALSSGVAESLAYRFIRCAEMVGESVAREKHWDRDEVFRVALRMHAPATFAALSRWRDREVGYFEDQLSSLAIHAAKTESVQATAIWCLSGFKGCNASVGLARICIEKESRQEIRQQILERTVWDALRAGMSLEKWKKFCGIADEFKLDPTILQDIKNRFEDFVTPPDNSSDVCTNQISESTIQEVSKWRNVFQECDVTDSSVLAKLLRSLLDSTGPRDIDGFWTEIIRAVPRGREAEFLKTFSHVENLTYFFAEEFIRSVPEEWFSSISVQKEWSSTVESIGKRFPEKTLNHLRFQRQWNYHVFNESNAIFLQNGILSGLQSNNVSLSAGTYFTFTDCILERITVEEARELLDFALSRFELHIPDEFGDGPWDISLTAPQDIPEAYTGLIWSALASPIASTRWEAAHSVRRLVEMECIDEMMHLFNWSKKGSANAFGCRHFPFYLRHAQQWLLIALARVSIDAPKSLIPYSSEIRGLLEECLYHVVFLALGEQIIRSIVEVAPDTIPEELLDRISKACISSYAPIRSSSFENLLNSPRHESGIVDTSLKIHFPFDFDQYWFAPLGRVFGISAKQVEELAREVAVREMEQKSRDDYQRDPRQKIWNSGYDRGRSTWIHHCSYPKIDSLDFYVGYHSLMRVAIDLHGSMPVIRPKDENETYDPWTHWKSRHGLRRRDKRWLSDRRDPCPSQRRLTSKAVSGEEWLYAITRDDFLDCIKNYNPLSDSLCVVGEWEDRNDGWVEHISVQSAFVENATTTSFVSALRLSQLPGSIWFPRYGEDRSDFGESPFDVQGWIAVPDERDTGLDAFDPFVESIRYPPYEIGEEFSKILEIIPDIERRQWLGKDGEVTAVCEIWSDRDTSPRDEDPFYSSQKLCIRADALRRICAVIGLNLVICVKIRRHKMDLRNFDKHDTYSFPWHEIIIFSEDGTLPDTQ